MDLLYCEECQLTFKDINDVKNHTCSKITNTEFKKVGSYELDMPTREIEQVNLKERIPDLQLFGSGIESTNTLIEEGVYRHFYENSFELSVENIEELDFSNTCFENHFQNSELGPPSLQPVADKGCHQTSENFESVISHESFKDLYDVWLRVFYPMIFHQNF
ncbi:hypothetical protein TNCV_2479741 [Trichonephila clavipes]|nr:hypothetical protein TNCV_2479741 [Trichonephila clavipes]